MIRNELTFEFNNTDYEILRCMWDDIFKDPADFADYYFSVVCKSNRVLTASKDNKIIGMLHCNPYEQNAFGENKKGVYIVGVAVLPEYRKQGVMKEMLHQAIEYMNNTDVCYAFLMPENVNYYIGSGFEQICPNDVYKIQIDEMISKSKNSEIIISKDEFLSDDLENLSNTLNNYLEKNYDVFCMRDSDYYRRVIKEYLAQNGKLVSINVDNNIKGTYCYGIDAGTMYVERMVFVDEEYTNIIFSDIANRAKILDCSEISITINRDHSLLLEKTIMKMECIFQKKEGKGYMIFNNFKANCHKNARIKYYYDEIV